MNATPAEHWRDELMIIALRARIRREQSRRLITRARAHARRSAWWIARARRARKKRTAAPAVVRRS